MKVKKNYISKITSNDKNWKQLKCPINVYPYDTLLYKCWAYFQRIAI